MSGQGKRALGSVFLILFGIPFAMAGIGLSFFSLTAYRDSLAMKSWVETPATLIEVDLETQRGSKSTTQRATATYTYKFEGKDYTGSRVGVHTGKDNIGSWQHDTYNTLKGRLEAGTTVPCYVNPQNPSESVLFREVRPGLLALITLLPLVFTGVGLGIFSAGIVRFIQGRRTALLQRRFPDEPWQWRPDWSMGCCRERGVRGPLPIVILAVVWNIAAWLVVLPLALKGIKANPYFGFLGLIPAAGLLLLIRAGYRIARWGKYGSPVLRLESAPIQRGGLLQATLPLGGMVRRADTVTATLQCIRRTVSGSGKNRTVSEDTLWERRDKLDCDTGKAILSVPIPRQQPDSDPPPIDIGVSWRVRVHVSVPGVDYDGTFELPVFGMAEASNTPASAVTAGIEAGRPAGTAVGPKGNDDSEFDLNGAIQSLQKSGLRLQRHPRGGIRVVCPPFRLKGTALGLCVFLLIWMVVTVLLFRTPDVPLIFRIVWPLTDLLVLGFLIYVLFWRAVVEVQQGHIRLRSGVLGSRVREMDASEVTNVNYSSSMRSGNRQYYTVRLVTATGKHTVASMIEGRHRADQLQRLLERSRSEAVLITQLPELARTLYSQSSLQHDVLLFHGGLSRCEYRDSVSANGSSDGVFYDCFSCVVSCGCSPCPGRVSGSGSTWRRNPDRRRCTRGLAGDACG